MEFFNQTAFSIAVNVVSTLCSAFIIFLAGIVILIKPRVKISGKIACTTDYKTNLPAYIFKIINRSYFITAYDFDIHLYAIEKIKNEHDNTYTTHYNNKEGEFELKYGTLKNLDTYKSNFMLFFIRLFNKKYTIPFDYFITALDDIKKHLPKYNALRLTVSYTDSFGKKQFITQDFDLTKQVIFEGEFANNGSLNKITSK